MVDKPATLRIDGELKPIKGEPVLTLDKAKNLIYTLLMDSGPDSPKKTFETNLELDLSYEIPGLARFRVNLYQEKGNIGLAARVIPSITPTMDEIAMPKIVYELIKMHQGLILVTGPTGCGKSTSLAAIINQIDKEQVCHIVTLEDPIEFVFKNSKNLIGQRELGRDMRSFADALRHVVRQDPNIIMVGEMRDLETIGTTLTLAETGHLVLATLHTQNAAQTVDRIIDVFPPYQQEQIRIQLSMTLRAVISQELLPRLGGNRIAAREIMINTPAVSNLIRENKIAQIKSVIQTSAKEGMVTMDQDLKRLYKEGLISKETAQKHILYADDDLK